MDIRDRIYAVINLGSSYITGMIANKTTQGRISPLAVAQEPTEECILHGAVYNIEVASQKVDKVIGELGVGLPPEASISSVYVGLDIRSMRTESKVLTREFANEIIREEDLRELEREARHSTIEGYEVIHISAPQYFVDGRPLARARGVRGSRLEARYPLVLVREELIQDIRQVLETNLSLQISGFIPNALAEASVVLRPSEMTTGCAYINIGGGTTSVSLFNRGFLRALYVLPLGGDSVTQDLTDLKLSKSVAEEVKVRQGGMERSVSSAQNIELEGELSRSSRSLSCREVNQYIYARMNEIVHNALSIIKQVNDSDSFPDLIFLGGATKVSGFYPYLRDKIYQGFRLGELSNDILSTPIMDDSYIERITELGLLRYADEPCVKFQEVELESFAIPSEPSSVTPSYTDTPTTTQVPTGGATPSFATNQVVDRQELFPEEEHREEQRERPKKSKSLGDFFGKLNLGKSFNRSSNTDDDDDEIE